MNANSARQHLSPLLYNSEERRVHKWQTIDLNSSDAFDYNENWLQQLLHSSPELIPVAEIEPAFSEIIPLCREMQTQVGPVDNVYINANGLLTIVECKLWRNGEARRKVVGQILDYAQQISQWSFSDLDRAVTKASNGKSLWTQASEAFGLSDEANFIDKVQHHLNNGTFLLLVIGDGIRSRTEEISNFMTSHAGLSFSFGLLEVGLFQHPHTSEILVNPRLLAKTVEIGRLIVQAEQGVVIEQKSSSNSGKPTTTNQPSTLTEEIFIEAVAGNSSLSSELRALFNDLKERGFSIAPNARGTTLKIWHPESSKFHYLQLSKLKGTFRNYCYTDPISMEYMSKLAALLRNCEVVETHEKPDCTTVKHLDGSECKIEELLDIKDSWIALIEETRSTILISSSDFPYA